MRSRGGIDEKSLMIPKKMKLRWEEEVRKA
jgi:hypothetical protein